MKSSCLDWNELDLDYRGENNYASFFASGSMIHTYPAKAVPDMINSILKKLLCDYDVKTVLDPFVGSGTTALEAKYLNLDFYGSDLNPLAVLLSRAKVLQIKDVTIIKKVLVEFTDKIIQEQGRKFVVLEDFENIEYWFKKENIYQLSYLKQCIKFFLNFQKENLESFALIILTAFSEAIRESSLSRKNEFKLYRMSKNDMKKFNVDSVLAFKKKVEELLDMIVYVCPNLNNMSINNIVLENAKTLNYLRPDCIDLVITSPPYGDSKSTVAYGEFSRLSIQWMGDLLKEFLDIDTESPNCDALLLGGNKSKIDEEKCSGIFSSPSVQELIKKIDENINSTTALIKESLEVLKKIEDGVAEDKLKVLDLLEQDTYCYSIFKERIRLEKFREYNNIETEFSRNEKKKMANDYSTSMMELYKTPELLSQEDCQKLEEFIIQVRGVLLRKLKYVPKRKNEVILFLKDLYQVVLETDRVLKLGGIQTWIVGHRTVFGDVIINLADILKEWFENLSYNQIANMERRYSFKRMPHHINSTLARNESVNTMMYEYILIMEKIKRCSDE